MTIHKAYNIKAGNTFTNTSDAFVKCAISGTDMHHETKVGNGTSDTDYLPCQFSFGFHIFNIADNYLVLLVYVESAIM